MQYHISQLRINPELVGHWRTCDKVVQDIKQIVKIN